MVVICICGKDKWCMKGTLNRKGKVTPCNIWKSKCMLTEREKLRSHNETDEENLTHPLMQFLLKAHVIFREFKA